MILGAKRGVGWNWALAHTNLYCQMLCVWCPKAHTATIGTTQAGQYSSFIYITPFTLIFTPFSLYSPSRDEYMMYEQGKGV